MRYRNYTGLFLVMVIVFISIPSWAGPDPIPITAEQAFDAVTSGIDPVSENDYGVGKIIIVDVRTPPEYQFQGTAGKVESIFMKGSDTPIKPDFGKVTLTHGGLSIEYKLDGKIEKTEIDKISRLVTSSIAVNIPCAVWNESTGMMDPTPDTFVKGIEKLSKEGVRVMITMCNSGGRSTACIAKFVPDELASRFQAIYEIDRAGEQYFNPEHKLHLAGLGGFQGSAYNGIYNGNSGYAGRLTTMQSVLGWKQGVPSGPSVSWKDSGLPIFIPETSCNLPEMPRTP